MTPDDIETLTRVALDDHPSATVGVSINGKVFYANTSAQLLFGNEDKPLKSLTDWNGETRPLHDILSKVSGSSSWVPIRFVRDEKLVYGRARGIRHQTEMAPSVLIVATTDATEPFVRHADHLQQLNDQLSIRQRAEARMNFALDAARIGIWEYDVATDTTWRSNRHDEIFGYNVPLPQWTIPLFLTHVVEEDRAPVQETIEDAIANQKPYRFQCRIVRGDGIDRWVSAEAAPQINADGKVVRLNGVVSDITEEKEAELRIEMAERMESLGQMAGGLAHDFANIIGIIRLQTEVASMTRDPEAVWTRLDAIQKAAERGAELAARTLAFAKREPGVADVICLRTMAAQIVELSLGEGRGTVAIDIDEVEDVHVYCDPGQLENALLNLVFNARDAMEETGTGDRIALTATRCSTGGMIQIAVSDNGPGMPKHILDRAADPFFTTKEGQGGTGLGLSSVAAFTASSDGGFRAQSHPGIGTTITLTLPEALPEAIELEETPSIKPASDIPPMRLIVVEDQPAFREALELMLQTMGHHVTAFSAALPALSAIKNGYEADALMTDILLPGGMSGVDLARASEQVRPELAIIYISGYADASKQHDAPKGQFLRKPVDRNDLIFALAKIAARKSLQEG